VLSQCTRLTDGRTDGQTQADRCQQQDRAYAFAVARRKLLIESTRESNAKTE